MLIDLLSSFKEENNSKFTGYPLNRFAQSPSLHFLCTLCGMVAREPLECHSCERLFCTLCLFSRERDREKNSFDLCCPSCGPKEKPKRPSKILIRIINELNMFCKYKDNGCSDSKSISKIPDHENLCKFRDMRCENRRFCRKQGLAKEFIEIQCERTELTGYVCSEKCEEILAFENSIVKKKKNEALEKYYKLLKTCDV